jgi:hypothetical protein
MSDWTERAEVFLPRQDWGTDSFIHVPFFQYHPFIPITSPITVSIQLPIRGHAGEQCWLMALTLTLIDP